MEEILIHAAPQINIEDIILSELSQLLKNKSYIIPFMWET